MDKDVSPKRKVLVEVTFLPSGVVRFFCKFHSALRTNGMLLTGDVKPLAAYPRNPRLRATCVSLNATEVNPCNRELDDAAVGGAVLELPLCRADRDCTGRRIRRCHPRTLP